MQTLTEIVQALEPRLRERLSSLRVEYDRGAASVTLSFALFTSSTRGVNTEGLPEGVGVAGFERWPDRTVPLSTETAIDEQIAALQRSGIVGNLDAARFQTADPRARDAGHPALSWVIKTHAGSDAERVAWLKGS